MKAASDGLRELLVVEPPAALDALVLERALAEFQRCALSRRKLSSRELPSEVVEGPARDRAMCPQTPCVVLSPVRS
jgi:hypothetical protein